MSWIGEFLSKLFGVSRRGVRPHIWKKRNVTRATAGSIDKWNTFGVDRDIEKIAGLSTSAKNVYIYRSRVSESNGNAIPFVGTIAKRTKLSKSTVNKAIKELEKARLLRTERRYSRRGGSSNLYHLTKVEAVYPEVVSTKTQG